MDEPDDELTKAERARIKRRDRDASAEDRALMNPGPAKWFKQVLDRQGELTREAQQSQPTKPSANKKRRPAKP